MKQEILDRLNDIIDDEKGVPVTMDSMFIDSELDSLGTLLTIVTLEADYPFWADITDDADAWEMLDIENLTIRELIRKCVLSTTTPYMEQSSKKDS